MAKVSEITEPYFSHDISARQDKSIIFLIEEMGFEGYGLFWAVVEFMHRNKLNVGEERLVVGKDNADKVLRILNDFKLFRIEDGEYISDRIQNNISKQEEKSKKAKVAANTKWILSALKKAHIDVFGKEPVLNDDEVKVFLNYSNKIPNLKDKLPDLLYTTQRLKFENKPDFVGSVNWLLKQGNLTQMLNGGFGELKNWQAHKNWLMRQECKGIEFTFDIDAVSSKAEAEELVLTHSNFDAKKNRFIVDPEYTGLIGKFDLSKEKLREMKIERISQDA